MALLTKIRCPDCKGYLCHICEVDGMCEHCDAALDDKTKAKVANAIYTGRSLWC